MPSVGLARRFTASGWLPDVRRYGATYFNYTGKPLAYILAQPERRRRRRQPGARRLRQRGGATGGRGVRRALRGRVIDVVRGHRGRAGRRPRSTTRRRVRSAGPGRRSRSSTPTATSCHGPSFDGTGALRRPGWRASGRSSTPRAWASFEGYYNNDEANRRATRNGWYWSGDLGYLDAEGFLYFAGRNADWIRVDGENFPAGPIEAIVARHPDVMLCAAYGVPDPEAGRPGDGGPGAARRARPSTRRPSPRWLDAQPDLSPKWRPTHVRISAAIPTSPTNKVLSRTLVHQKYRPDRVGDDALWVRERGADRYRRFGIDDADTVRDSLERTGRSQFWDL